MSSMAASGDFDDDARLEALGNEIGQAQTAISKARNLEEKTELSATYAAKVTEYVKLHNCQPYSPFNAMRTSLQLGKPTQLALDDTNSVRWSLKSCKDVAPAVVALLNSRRVGVLTLPPGVTSDEVAGEVRKIEPSVTCPSWGASDGRAVLLRWEQPAGSSGGSLRVVAKSQHKLHLSNISIRQRVGATGKERTVDAVLGKLSSISPEDINTTTNIKVTTGYVESVEHLATTCGETDMLEDKETAWWAGAKILAEAVSGNYLAQRLNEHLKKYIVEMYELAADGSLVSASLSLGVREGDHAVVGVPMDDKLDSAQLHAQLLITDTMSRLFPAPPLNVCLNWTRLDSSGSLDKAARDRDGQLLVATDKAAVKSVGAVATWVLAVRVDEALGVIFGLPEGWTLAATNTICVAVPPKKNKPEAKAKTVRIQVTHAANEDVKILPHFLVTATTQASGGNSRCVASSALFRGSSFDCMGLFEGPASILLAYTLSPFAVWAMLQHLEQPTAVWRHVRRTYHREVHVVPSLETAIMPPLPKGVTYTPLHSIPKAGQHPQVLVLLGFAAWQLRPLLQAKRQLVLLDVDPIRLQAAVKATLDEGSGSVVIVDVGLFEAWDCLAASSESDDVAHRAGTLLKPMELAPTASSEGRALIRRYLIGDTDSKLADPTSIFYGENYVTAAAVRRDDEETALYKVVCRFLVSSAAHEVAHAMLRGAGTTTIVHRLALRLRRKERTLVEVVHTNDTERVAAVKKVLWDWAKKGAPADVGRVVALVVADKRGRSVAADLRRLLARLLQRSPDIIAGVLEVVVHDIFDTEAWDGHHFVLSPVLHGAELSSFVDHYSAMFPNKADDLGKLVQGEHIEDMVFVGLPGLIVSGGLHGSCLKAISQLLDRTDPTRQLPGQPGPARVVCR